MVGKGEWNFVGFLALYVKFLVQSLGRFLGRGVWLW